MAVDAGTTWTPVAGSSGCWSTPVAVPTENITYNGILFRAYRSFFSCPLTTNANVFQLPSTQFFNWVSSCQTGTLPGTKLYHYTQTVTLNNASGSTTLTKDNGWANSMNGL